MNKIFFSHILKVVLFFIITASPMLSALEITDNMKNEYLKQKVLKEKEQSFDTPEITEPTAEINIINIPELEKEKVPPRYFGYDYFLKRESISLYENLPTPDYYQFGPGDEIIINIWGDMQLQSAYTINRDGNVFIDKLGQLSIVGKTISQAEASLKNRFQTVFSTMGGENPSTFFDLSIGKLKSININIIGEAFAPGMHSLHPFSTISTALIQAGGIDTTGTLRSIKLIRNGSQSSELDFYDFLILGKMIDDVHLQDGDVIFIPLRYSSIKISGAVNKDGIFELTDNENFGSLLSYCGGLQVSAQNMIEIKRVLSIDERQFEDFAREVTMIKSSDLDFHLRDGDKVFVNRIMEVNQTVSITGTVKVAGNFPFIAGMTLMDLMKYAGGLNDSSFIQKMDLEKVELVRREKDKEYPVKFDINVQEIINGDSTKNIVLKNWDVVHIRRNINFDPPEKVEITGEVKSPGSYTLIKRIETIKDIINRSGGYTDRAYREGIKIFRGKNQIILKNFDMPLINRDSIFVPQHTSVIEVTGEIYHPGYVQYIDNKSLNYYIERAGGFTLQADNNSIMVIYANGDIDIVKRFHKPKILEGCHIVVQREKDKEDFDLTEFLKEVTSIMASLATIIYIVTYN